MPNKTFVSFEFSSGYLYADYDSEFCGYLKKGTIDSAIEKYREVEVESRDITKLTVPKGVFRFRFYDREVLPPNKKGRILGNKINISPQHYIVGNIDVGELYTPDMKIPEDSPTENFYYLRMLLNWIKSNSIKRLYQTSGGWQGGCEKEFILQSQDIIVPVAQLREEEWIPDNAWLNPDGNR